MSTNRVHVIVPLGPVIDDLCRRIDQIRKSDLSGDRLLFVHQRVDRLLKEVQAQIDLAIGERDLQAREASCEQIRSILASALYDLEVRQ